MLDSLPYIEGLKLTTLFSFSFPWPSLPSSAFFSFTFQQKTMHQENENPQHQQDQHHQHPDQLQQKHKVRSHFLKAPTERKTSKLAWLFAVFCVILWVIIIAGGLIVLIVYLLFRPRSPRFDIPSATLNAAYADMGSLLNADLTILANFSNPNKKVDVSFDYLVVDVYYGRTLISTSSIESFSERRQESKLVNMHFVSSEVTLPLEDIERLHKEMENNEVTLDIKGSFRTRSKYGSLLQFSYWLHSRCNIVVGSPPSGALRSSKCRTKR